MSRSVNHHGYPVHDGETLTAEDCPRCSLPTLLAEHYGEPRGQVRLDALPLRVFEPSVLYGAYAICRSPELPPLYLEHACPMPGTP